METHYLRLWLWRDTPQHRAQAQTLLYLALWVFLVAIGALLGFGDDAFRIMFRWLISLPERVALVVFGGAPGS